MSGAVRFDGQVPIGAQIALHPVTALNADAIAVTPTGQVKADGSFVVTSYKAGDGAPPGEYVVTIQWYKIDKEGTVGPNVIPEQYTRPKTSPIKVSVKGGSPTVLEPIAISSAKTAGVARRTY